MTWERPTEEFEQYVAELLTTFIEVKIKEQSDFLKIKETLTRIGVPSEKPTGKVLWQSCHILHKKGKLYIVHFKELFALDGKQTDFDQQDLARRNAIAKLLSDWKLLTIVNPEVCEQPIAPLFQIKVIAFRDKHNWKLVPKYSIGKKDRKDGK